jgi:hypothetical protein
LPTAVRLGDLETAVDLLNATEALFAPYLLLVRDDPRLALLRAHPEIGPKVSSWITEDWPRESPT